MIIVMMKNQAVAKMGRNHGREILQATNICEHRSRFVTDTKDITSTRAAFYMVDIYICIFLIYIYIFLIYIYINLTYGF